MLTEVAISCALCDSAACRDKDSLCIHAAVSLTDASAKLRDNDALTLATVEAAALIDRATLADSLKDFTVLVLTRTATNFFKVSYSSRERSKSPASGSLLAPGFTFPWQLTIYLLDRGASCGRASRLARCPGHPTGQ